MVDYETLCSVNSSNFKIDSNYDKLLDAFNNLHHETNKLACSNNRLVHEQLA